MFIADAVHSDICNFSSYYVAYAEVATQLAEQRSATTIIIGNNGVTTVGGTIFTNPPPVVGEDYYVFIRLYSAIDVSQT